MEGDPGACGTAVIVFYRHKKKQKGICTIGLLGNKKLSGRAKKKLPDLGVSVGASVLVLEWNHLRG